MRITERQAARAILLTPDDEVLLMRVEVQNGSFWICPGGGLQAGETAPMALRRELAEELALEDAQIGPLLWKRRQEMTLYGRRWHQSEDYFAIATARFTPRMQDAAEARILREFRWWHPTDLRHSTEAIVPQSLLRIILDFRAMGPPQAPLGIEIVSQASTAPQSILRLICDISGLSDVIDAFFWCEEITEISECGYDGVEGLCANAAQM